MHANRVLVFPRVIFGDVFSLLPWDSIQEQIEKIENTFSWLDRPDAERSNDWVQAIPCVFIRDHEGKYCVLRRVQNSRNDLNKKLSLVVGGHIDETHDHGSFQTAMSSNLIRELEEEIGIIPQESPRPIGVIIDYSSIEASRHVAFLHAMKSQQVSPKASEEFAMRSKYKGAFVDAPKLTEMRDKFDPWSKLLIEEYVCRGDVLPQPRQRSFL